MAAVSAAVLAGVAGLLSGLALSQHGQPAPDCGESCATALASPWATIPFGADLNTGFGLPVALLGLMYFSALAAWLFLVIGHESATPTQHRATLAVSGVGAVISIAFLGVMLSGGYWCPLCLATHIVSLTILPFVWAAKPAGGESPMPANWRLVGAVAALIFVGELAAWFGWDGVRLRREQQQLVLALARAEASPGNMTPPATFVAQTHPAAVVDAKLADRALVTATAQPSATLEIFTDLMCPSCRVFEDRLLADYLPLFNGRLNVVWRHFPLCAQCNPGMSDLHPWACEAAYLVEAARLQGGTEAAKAMMHEIDPQRSTPFSEAELGNLARKCGLDAGKLMADSQSDVIRNRVSEDVRRGKALGLRATPSLLLNGRPVPSEVRNQTAYWQEVAANLVADLPATKVAAANTTAKPVADAPPQAAKTAPADEVPLTTDPQKLETAKAMLADHDTNQDGVLDAAEAAKVYKKPSVIDRNHDQKITLNEIAAGIVNIQSDEPAADAPADPKEAATAEKSKPKAESPRMSTIFEGDVLDLKGKTLDNQEFDLKQWQGKTVLAVFWATWCGHCVEETADLLHLYRSYHDRGLEIVGISSDRDLAQMRQFVSQNQLPWPQLVAEDAAAEGKRNPLTIKYNVRGLPTVALIGSDGKVQAVSLRSRELELAVAKSLAVEPVAEAESQQQIASLREKLLKVDGPPPASNPLKVGDVVQVAGPTLDGGSFDIAQHRGKAVLVAFWATWCPHCKKELPKLLELHARYQDRGLQIVGVSLDRKQADLEGFLGSKPLPWPTIYMDRDGLRGFNNPLAHWFSVRGIPALFLVDQEGKLAALKPRGATLELEIAKLLGEAPPSAQVAETPAATATPTTSEKTAEPPAAVAVPVPKAAKKPRNAVAGSPLTEPKLIEQITTAMMKKYDQDNDGLLIENEWIQAKGDMGAFDIDKDGQLTFKELSSAILLAQQKKVVELNKKSAATVPE